MKKIVFPLLASLSSLACFSQGMVVKQHNYTTFFRDEKKAYPAVEKQTSTEGKQHPEYGILPFNADCYHCAELIDKRTVDSRTFINPDSTYQLMYEKSLFPLHYKNSENDVWHTIDYRLRPVDGTPGVYAAPNQPWPTKCDLNRKISSINLGDAEFEFNRDLTLYFFDEEKAYVKPEKGNYTNYTIGEEGLRVKNIWHGIDMEQTYRAGEIETNYVIRQPLSLPIDNGYMVIEDHFTLPKGFTIKEAETGRQLDNGYFSGDYKIGNGKGDEILYRKPAYFDARAVGMQGMYNLIRKGEEITLQMMIPVKWLNMAGNLYPLTIDPSVLPDSAHSGHSTDGGSYTSGGGPPSGYKFSSYPGSCNDSLIVTFPGGVSVEEAYTEVEYQLTYSATCGPGPFCTFSEVTQQVINNTCGISSGIFQCQPAPAPHTNICTTDSILDTAARPIRINNYVPNYLACIAPQASQYVLLFTLENRDSSACLDACGTLCAVGHIWVMTVVGYRVVGELSTVGYPPADSVITVCQGDTVHFKASAQFGVPSYNYSWIIDSSGTLTSSPDSNYLLVATDPAGYNLSCKVSDFSDFYYITNSYKIIVISSPPITKSGDTLFAPYPDSAHQWYFNGSLLSGDTLSYVVATQIGSYTVSFPDSNGCTMTTSPYVTALNDLLALKNIIVFPNPTIDGWELSVANDLIGGKVQIYSALGQLVYQTDIRGLKSEIAPQLAAGVYQLLVLNKAGQSVYQQSLEKAN